MNATLARVLYCLIPAIIIGGVAALTAFVLMPPAGSWLQPTLFTGVFAAWAFGFGWSVTDPDLDRDR